MAYICRPVLNFHPLKSHRVQYDTRVMINLSLFCGSIDQIVSIFQAMKVSQTLIFLRSVCDEIVFKSEFNAKCEQFLMKAEIPVPKQQQKIFLWLNHSIPIRYFFLIWSRYTQIVTQL